MTQALRTDCRVALLGVPYDGGSSFLRGAAAGPEHLRRALHSYATNLCTEDGLDLAADRRWRDAGDVAIADDTAALAAIEAHARRLWEGGERVLAVGGDHAVSWPLVRACAAVHGRLAILHLDAHPDLYDALDGRRDSHACPFARVLEEGLASRLVQVGIRTSNPHQRAQAARFGVETIAARGWPRPLALSPDTPLYVSIDLDVLDPAFAPGVSHHEPGGLATRDVLGIIQSLPGSLVGGDIVELNPARDLHGVTAAVAAKLVKELLGAVLRSGALDLSRAG